MDPLEEARRTEVMEGILDAIFKGDRVTFDVFYSAWETIDVGPDAVRFNGMPTPYIAELYCVHCEKGWEIQGASFDDANPVNEHDCIKMHVKDQCPNGRFCHCFDPDSPTTMICQVCFLAFSDCPCFEFAVGPCVDPLVTMRWLR